MPSIGLCSDCVHAKRLNTKGGSVIFLCGLSAGNPAFAKFPLLPVTTCAGYLKIKP